MILKGTSLTYLWIVGLLLFIKLSVLPGSVIINIIKKLFRLLIISAIVLLPSIVISQNDMTLFLIRVGLILVNISIFLAITSWQQFILALRQWHLPTIIILVIDITIKYIYMLGMFLEELLYSIRLRTLGQHVSRQVLGALLGQLYLSSKERTTETYQAMVLRGYSRDSKGYSLDRRLPFNRCDFGVLVELVALIVLYFI